MMAQPQVPPPAPTLEQQLDCVLTTYISLQLLGPVPIGDAEEVDSRARGIAQDLVQPAHVGAANRDFVTTYI